MNTINFVPQQNAEISPLIKMNCIISEKPNKNLVNVHNGKEKGKEKIEENKINQEKSKKKLKTIKLNLKPNENKVQTNKIMSTGRLSSNTVLTYNQKSQHVKQYTSTHQGKSSNTGRRITGHESTLKNRTYYRSTPIAKVEQVS